MYKVITSDGFVESCESRSEAEARADLLWEDSDRSVSVAVYLNGKVIYQAGQ